MKNLRVRSSKIMPVIGACLAVFLLTRCSEAKTNGQSEGAVAEPELTIHAAAFMGDMDAIKEHIKIGTDLNAKDEYGSTPLSIATTFGKEDVAVRLIQAGADLYAKSADGSTALHTAAFFCRTAVVKALLEKGIDTTIRNSFGATALESVSASFSEVKVIYDQLSKDLGPFGLKLDYDRLEKTRPVIAKMIESHQ